MYVRQVVGVMEIKENYSMLLWRRIGWEENWLDLSQRSAWLGSVRLWRTFAVCSSGTCVHIWVCKTKVRVVYMHPRQSGWLSDCPDGVKSLWSPVYAPSFGLFSMYACWYVSLRCIQWFWSVYCRDYVVLCSYLGFSVFLSCYWCIGWLLNQFL